MHITNRVIKKYMGEHDAVPLADKIKHGDAPYRHALEDAEWQYLNEEMAAKARAKGINKMMFSVEHEILDFWRKDKKNFRFFARMSADGARLDI